MFFGIEISFSLVSLFLVSLRLSIPLLFVINFIICYLRYFIINFISLKFLQSCRFIFRCFILSLLSVTFSLIIFFISSISLSQYCFLFLVAVLFVFWMLLSELLVRYSLVCVRLNSLVLS